MSRGFTFRTTTGLIVGAYAVIAAVLVVGAGRDLGQVVGAYAPQVSWLMQGTTDARVEALLGAGRPETASLYAFVVAISWSMISALTAAGFAWGVLNKGATELGVDKAMNYLTALAGLYALATCTEIALHALHLNIPQAGLHAIPGVWFGTMIPSAAILARIGALIAHDAGSLIAIAIAGEPKRLAELVANAEAVRGAESMEARLARLIAARRRPG
jgi:hypothetical protein